MKSRRTLYIVIICIAVVAVIAFAAYKSYNDNKVYTNYEVDNNREIDRNINYLFYKYSSGVLCYSDDGISYVRDGKEIWNHAFEIKNPVIDICGDYIALGNMKSNEIHLYGRDGSDTTIKTKYSLINVEVSEQGIVAAVLEDEKANYFQVSDREGNELVTGRTVLKGNGYPLDFSLSQDGTKMVVSYIYVSGGVTQSKVLFYNFSEIGQSSTDRMVGGFNQYNSTIVPEVEFVNNNTAVAIGDNMFTIYKIKEKPSVQEEIKLEEKIKSVFYSDKYIGMVFESDDAGKAYKLRVYDLTGSNIYTTDINGDYTELQFAGDCVLKYSDTECQLMSLTDVEKFKCVFDKGIVKMIPVKGHTNYLLISSGNIEEVHLK